MDSEMVLLLDLGYGFSKTLSRRKYISTVCRLSCWLWKKINLCLELRRGRIKLLFFFFSGNRDHGILKSFAWFLRFSLAITLASYLSKYRHSRERFHCSVQTSSTLCFRFFFFLSLSLFFFFAVKRALHQRRASSWAHDFINPHLWLFSNPPLNFYHYFKETTPQGENP